ncbi:MAG: phytanoyl-CoA dioxygenase family protein [Acidobacteria bacterium]|nr:phytanoyl-CoA dioxygenase family protein [Acidobacteriota bacterium]
MLTLEQHRTFAQTGVLRIEGVVPAEPVGAARETIQYAIDIGAKPSRYARSKPVSGVFRPAIAGVAEELAGRPVSPWPAPTVLVTQPGTTVWTVPSTGWHVDIPRLAKDGVPGVQAFVLLGRVKARGGGTLVVAGSHRLLDGEPMRSKDVKRRLRSKPWFNDLMSKQVMNRHHLLTESACVDGVSVRVLELCGAPGDVYFTDMRLLHASSPNTREAVRIMVTQRYAVDAYQPDIRSAYETHQRTD